MLMSDGRSCDRSNLLEFLTLGYTVAAATDAYVMLMSDGRSCDRSNLVTFDARLQVRLPDLAPRTCYLDGDEFFQHSVRGVQRYFALAISLAR